MDCAGVAHPGSQVSILVLINLLFLGVTCHCYRVDSLNVQNETLINWKSLSHPGSGLELWSGRNLLHRWMKLKAVVADFKEKSHRGMLFNFICFSFQSDAANRNNREPSREIQGPSNLPHWLYDSMYTALLGLDSG